MHAIWNIPKSSTIVATEILDTTHHPRLKSHKFPETGSASVFQVEWGEVENLPMCACPKWASLKLRSQNKLYNKNIYP